ncbi:MAG: hypothetical protein J5I98_33550 [Phaeodactylibacter sp.]|nr:hypothetical protein [Phaeodactylibacter sp.]
MQQERSVHSLVFYRFFHRLRRELGMDLDARQYRNFLHCLLLGKARDKEGLLELCKAMWLARPQFRPRFEELFEEAYKTLPQYWAQLVEEHKSAKQQEERTETERKSDPLRSAAETPKPNVEESPARSEPPPSPSPPPEINKAPDWREIELSFDEGEDNEGSVPKEDRETPSQLDTPFLFSEEKYLPFQQRKAKQSWRRLKQQSIRQPTEEIDVERTVRALAGNGFFYEIFYETRKVSRQHFVVLFDHGGSMTPYQYLFEFFESGLRESTNYTQIETYYFTNFPLYHVGQSGLPEYRFFTSMRHTNSVSLNSLFTRWEKKTAVLFLSDGGASHPGINPERVQVTMDLLRRLEAKVEHLVWFNPLPRRFWQGTAAALFAGSIPMVECTEAGILEAVRGIR